MTLSLQDAIVLGDTLKTSNPRAFLEHDGSGCAFGGALLACGVTFEQLQQEMAEHVFMNELPCVKSLWPWLTLQQIGKITSLYHAVAEERATIFDIRDYVREIEPRTPPAVIPDVSDVLQGWLR